MTDPELWRVELQRVEELLAVRPKHIEADTKAAQKRTDAKLQALTAAMERLENIATTHQQAHEQARADNAAAAERLRAALDKVPSGPDSRQL